MIGIYKITNKVNGKCYIGQSKSIHNRWRQHISDLENKNHHCFKLQDEYNEYGMTNFTFEVICLCEEYDLTKMEQFNMNKYKDKLYNSNRAMSLKSIKSNQLNKNIFFIPKDNIMFDSINSQRIFFMIINKALLSNQRYVEISVKEFIEETNIRGNSIYERFIEFSKELSDIKINDKNVFEYCNYDNYAICINLTDYIVNYIKLNKNNDAINNLKFKDIIKLKYVKSLPIIIQLNNNNRLFISIDNIKRLLKLENNYENYSEFKRNTLNKIIMDLKEIGLQVGFKEHKEGKKIKEILIQI